MTAPSGIYRWVLLGVREGFVVGLLLTAVGLLLAAVAIYASVYVYDTDGSMNWRFPAGIVFTLCALHMTWDGIRACIEARSSA